MHELRRAGLFLALAGCASVSRIERLEGRVDATCVRFEAYQLRERGKVEFPCTPSAGIASVKGASVSSSAGSAQQ